MNEDQAHCWLASQGVSRETVDLLTRFAAILKREQVSQNLISDTTIEAIWSRHIVDSAQLVRLVTTYRSHWHDVGSGAGLPGLIVAIITKQPVTLIEPRRRRAEFLRVAIDELQLQHVTVEQSRVEKLSLRTVEIITARAVSALPNLLTLCQPITGPDTQWILPRGRNAHAELESLPKTWQGDWTIHESVTDASSFILVGRNVRTNATS